MRISVLGSGSWGTAISRLLANNGHDVSLWSAVAEEIDFITATRRHPILSNLVVPDQVSLTKSIEEACTGFDMIVCAVPSPYVRGTFESAAPFIQENQLVVSVTKGIESSTLMTMTDIIADVVRKPLRLAALSGPTHAEEVAVDLPTAILASSKDIVVANTVQQVFDSKTFRVFTSPDMRGVELCGALKNIIALAAGISEGLGYGDNAKAALITRGLVEISCLGHAMGCQEQTFYGLAGIGDMIVTATSRHSRNNRAGNLLGRGFSAATARKEVGMVIEGLNVLPAAMRMKEMYGVELPVITGVNDIVNGRSPRLAAQRMMTGSTTAEMVKSV